MHSRKIAHEQEPFAADTLDLEEIDLGQLEMYGQGLDVGSRPYGKSVRDGKPGAIVSVSPGVLSAFGANHHLWQSLAFLNVPAMQQPEAYLGNVKSLLGEDGRIKEEGTKAKFMDSYAKWVRALLAAR